MKRKPRSFGVQLWACFALFAAAILALLWLLQTVFLQSFYDRMAIRNVQKTAQRIVSEQHSGGFYDLLDELAYQNSFLLFLTDSQGNIIYSTDEHSGAYARDRSQFDTNQENPYFSTDALQRWQIGAGHYRSLPEGYGVFLEKLAESGSGKVGYRLDDGPVYVYGCVLSGQNDGVILYISTMLEAAGAAAGILRTQLLLVLAVSLLLSFALALVFARRFSQPVSQISTQAARMAAGDFACHFEKGFSSELDGLADTLNQTAAALSKAEMLQRDFLANISHDLRTPLTMIRGYAEMVRDISWEEEEDREKDLAVIIRETERLTGLVNEILEYNALQSKSQRTAFERVDISAAAEQVLARFAPLCSQNGFSLDVQIEPLLYVRGDERQLARVLYNLIDNAICHTGESRKVRTVIRRTEEIVRVEVRDFGDGIPLGDLPYVWDRYFTRKQRMRSRQISGLGLAISKEILAAHGARFGAESSEGEGSLFWFELEHCQ